MTTANSRAPSVDQGLHHNNNSTLKSRSMVLMGIEPMANPYVIIIIIPTDIIII